MQYNHFRWYDPKIGRWLTTDPTGFAAGDTNLNRYVGSDPLNFVDPSGLHNQPPPYILGKGPALLVSSSDPFVLRCDNREKAQSMDDQQFDQEVPAGRMDLNSGTQLVFRGDLERAALIAGKISAIVYLGALVCFPCAWFLEWLAGPVLLYIVCAAGYCSVLSAVTIAICRPDPRNATRIIWGVVQVAIFFLLAPLWYSIVETGIDLHNTMAVLEHE